MLSHRHLTGITITGSCPFHKPRRTGPAKTYGVAFVLVFLASYVFGMFLGPNPSMALGVGAGAAAGLFWVAFSLWTNDLFERRPFALTLINGGYHTVKFILIGLSFALIG